MDKWDEHIDNKFGGGCVFFYNPRVHKTNTIEEQVERLQKWADKTTHAVSKEFEKLIPSINKLVDAIYKFSKTLLQTYPNKRVVYLALHGKKKRTRKKNKRRIIKWLQEADNGGE